MSFVVVFSSLAVLITPRPSGFALITHEARAPLRACRDLLPSPIIHKPSLILCHRTSTPKATHLQRPAASMGAWPRSTSVVSPDTHRILKLDNIVIYGETTVCIRRDSGGAWGCKTLSVNSSSSFRSAPLRGAAERRRAQRAGAPSPPQGGCLRENWSRAGHNGFLLGCHQTHPQQIHDDPPHQS
jgi:hypothetical protein